MTSVLRNIKTNDIYLHLSGNKFRNLRTGVQGEIPDQTLINIFRLNMEATVLINQYPLVEKLINQLNLKIENNE